MTGNVKILSQITCNSEISDDRLAMRLAIEA
jgi:hypothetical protein